MSFRTDALPRRLSAKITILPGGCWEWSGAVNHQGYGLAYKGNLPSGTPGKLVPAHRLIREVLVGPITPGMQLDHGCHDPETCAPGPTCPHRRCVNPEHTAEATGRDNTLRAGSITAANAAKTACRAGHPLTGDNLYVAPDGERQCRQCARDRRAARSPAQVEETRRKDRARAARNRATNPDRVRESQRRWRARKQTPV